MLFSDKHIRLYPGNIIYLSKNYDNIPDDEVSGEQVAILPNQAIVTYSNENICPMEYFTNANGNVVLKSENDNEIFFNFECQNTLEGIYLNIPETCSTIINKVLVDGVELTGEFGLVFDEEYLKYPLPILKNGTHTIVIQKSGGVANIFLSDEEYIAHQREALNVHSSDIVEEKTKSLEYYHRIFLIVMVHT